MPPSSRKKISTFQDLVEKGLNDIPFEKARAPETPVHSKPVHERDHRNKIISHLIQTKTYHSGNNRLHIGVAGFFNFDITAITKPTHVLLLDMNPKQERFWKTVVTLLGRCESPEKFMESYRRLKTVRSGAFPPPADFLVSESFFQREAYEHLHKTALQGNIATATLDIVDDRDRAERLGQIIRSEGLHLDTAYWSNIGAYIAPRGHDEVNTKGYVSTKDTIFGENDRGRRIDLRYESLGYRGSYRGLDKWDGEEKQNNKPIEWQELPAFERMVRNISVIGGTQGTHFLTDIAKNKFPLVITDGPPRHLARIAARRRRIESETGKEMR